MLTYISPLKPLSAVSRAVLLLALVTPAHAHATAIVTPEAGLGTRVGVPLAFHLAARFSAILARLPGIDVGFLNPTFWQLYKWRIVGLVSLSIIEALLIAGLLVERSRRRYAERERSRLAAEIEAEHRRMSGILANLPAAVWEAQVSVDEKQFLQTNFVSDYAERMLGYTKHDWLNNETFWTSHIHPEDRPWVLEHSRTAIERGSDEFDYRMIARDGREVWLHDTVTVENENGRPVGRGLMLDITERKRAETLRDGQSRILEMIAAGARLEDVLERLVLLIESQSDGMIGSILLLDDDGLHVRHVAGSRLPEAYIKAIDGAAIGPRAGSCGTAMYLRKAVIVSDILTDPLWHDYREVASAHGLRACWSNPIRSHAGKILGTFGLYYTAPRSPTQVETKLIDIATHIAGIAIEGRLAEEALRHSEERNRAILRAIPDLMFLQDKDGTYLDYHAKDPGILLVKPEDFLGKTMYDVLSPDLSSLFDGCFRSVLETAETQTCEYTVKIGEEQLCFEGRVALCEGDKLLTVVRDITDRKRAQDAVQSSEKRFAKAFRANPQPMSLTTVSDGRYIDVNESFIAMSGYEREEILNRTSLDLKIWETPADRAAFIKLLTEQGSVRNVETKFRTRDGSIRVLLSSAELIDIGDQRCLLVASSDITERKQSEQWLSELTARLLRSQDEERRRIARELHDVTAQNIGLILLNLAQVQKATATTIDVRSKDKLADSVALGEQSLREIRTLSYVLHPPLLDQAGLVTALQWYVKGFSERSGIKVDFAESGNDDQRMPPDVEYSLFRVVQECLTNIRRHTNSETAFITLTRTDEDVVLQVRDLGTGARLEEPEDTNGIGSLGVGIPGMRHRLKQLGGDLVVESVREGTTVTATVPVKWVVYDSYSTG